MAAMKHCSLDETKLPSNLSTSRLPFDLNKLLPHLNKVSYWLVYKIIIVIISDNNNEASYLLVSIIQSRKVTIPSNKYSDKTKDILNSATARWETDRRPCARSSRLLLSRSRSSTSRNRKKTSLHSGWVSNNLRARRAKTAAGERPAAPRRMSSEVRGECHTVVLIIAVGGKI